MWSSRPIPPCGPAATISLLLLTLTRFSAVGRLLSWFTTFTDPNARSLRMFPASRPCSP